jgi:hypothetical protein
MVAPLRSMSNTRIAKFNRLLGEQVVSGPAGFLSPEEEGAQRAGSCDDSEGCEAESILSRGKAGGAESVYFDERE